MKRRRFTNGGVCVLAVLAVLLLGGAASGQEPSKSSQTRARTKSAQPVPWLVTVVQELTVEDFINDLRASGMSIRIADGPSAAAQSITNIASGLVVDKQGRILARLGNLNIKPKLESVTVITNSGRRFRPRSIETDEATGYAVIEVPDLRIEPPPVAANWTASTAKDKDKVRFIYQAPEQMSLMYFQMALAEEQTFKATQAAKPAQKVDATRLKKAPAPTIKVQVVEGFANIALDTSRPAPQAAQLTPLEPWPFDVTADCGAVLNDQGELIGLTEIRGPKQGVVQSFHQLRSLVERLKTQTQELAEKNQLARPANGRTVSEQLALREPTRLGVRSEFGWFTSKEAQGWLGVRLKHLTSEEVQRRFPTAGHTGSLHVTEVIPESPAARAGVKAGDYILRINGQVVRRLPELRDRLAALPLDKETPLEVLREGKLQQLKVVIAPRPQPAAPEAKQLDEARDQAASALQSPSGPVSPAANRQLFERLGVTMTALTEPLREVFGVKGVGGVLVEQVYTIGLAHRSGLRAGDVIFKVNDDNVTSPHDCTAAINRALPSGQVALTVLRKKQPVLVIIEPGKKSPER
jgi:S1-C subfamily serine protease